MDILAKNVALVSPFRVKLDWRVLRTLGRHHRSSTEACCVLINRKTMVYDCKIVNCQSYCQQLFPQKNKRMETDDWAAVQSENGMMMPRDRGKGSEGTVRSRSL